MRVGLVVLVLIALVGTDAATKKGMKLQEATHSSESKATNFLKDAENARLRRHTVESDANQIANGEVAEREIVNDSGGEDEEVDASTLVTADSAITGEARKSMEEFVSPIGMAPYYSPGPISGPPVVQHLNAEINDLNPSSPRSIVINPSFGPTSGGVWVQIVGAGSFYTPNSLQCKLDLVEQFCYSNHYMYSWCYLTPKCAGVYPFNCRNGPLQFQGKYAVVAKTPWVTSVYPFSGDTSGGTPITVRGWNFEPHCPKNLLCRFGQQIVPAKFYTSSSIMCIAPCNANRGYVSVEVSNDGGNHWSMSGVQYGYVGDPVDLAAGDCQRYVVSDPPFKSAH